MTAADPTAVATTVGDRRLTAAGRVAQQTGVPVVIALTVGAVALLATGADPVATYALLAREAAGSVSRVAATLTATTPVLLTGLATAVAFRAGVFNVGVEGSFLAGGLAAAVIGAAQPAWPAPLAIAVPLAAACAAGACIAWGPALLRAHLEVDEVVTTLMANFIVAGVITWLVTDFLLAPGVANNATEVVGPAARLPRLLPPSQLDIGLPIALVVAVTYWLWLRNSTRGYEVRMTGLSPAFAAAHGMAVPRVIISVMILSGLVGGLGGGIHALGVIGRYVEGFSPGYGFTGIAVALLGRGNPIGIVIAAVLFGALASAGATVQLFSDIPLDLVDILQGTIMLFAVIQLDRRRAGAG